MSPPSSYAAALETALAAADEARRLLLAECARPEGPRGPRGACPADTEAEHLIRARLLAAFPGWGFLGEETGRQAAAPGEPHLWVVDPNDGTDSMQRGRRGHAVAIALLRDGLPVLGVVSAVNAPDDDGDLIAWAEGCGPLRRNGRVVERRAWPDTLGPYDVLLVSQSADHHPAGNLACAAPARIMNMPSIAYRLALAAAGDAALALSLHGTSPWDIAAGHALLRGVGGTLLDERGEEVRYTREGDCRLRACFGSGAALARQVAARPWLTAPGSGFGAAEPPPSLRPARPRPGDLVHDAPRLRRAQGCLLGQVAGDALGALVEFQSADRIAAAYPDGGPHLLANGGPHGISAGQPMDDSELALLLARTLLARGGYDPEAAVTAYAAWYHGWTHTDAPQPCDHAWCRPFDVGGTTSRALSAVTAAAVADGRAAATARAAANPASEANGALMRVSPLGIWGWRHPPAVVAAAAREDARLTHPSPVCQDASAVFAVAIAIAIRDGAPSAAVYDAALDWARAEHLQPSVLRTLDAAASAAPADFLSNQGWVLLALQNAFYHLRQGTPPAEALVATVRGGGDTDTNAAICGALLGAVHGREALPAQWRRMVLTCRPMPGHPGIGRPRPAQLWPADALVLAERLLL